MFVSLPFNIVCVTLCVWTFSSVTLQLLLADDVKLKLKPVVLLHLLNDADVETMQKELAIAPTCKPRKKTKRGRKRLDIGVPGKAISRNIGARQRLLVVRSKTIKQMMVSCNMSNFYTVNRADVWVIHGHGICSCTLKEPLQFKHEMAPCASFFRPVCRPANID